MPDSNPSVAFDVLSQYLKTHKWKHRKMKNDLAFLSERSGETYGIKYYFQIFPDHEQFAFYITPEINIPDHLLSLVAEFICRANFGMRIGNFELDFNDGQVCFRSSVNFKGAELTEALIDGVIQPALTAYDEFFPGVRMVYAEIETPEKAIRKIERGS